MNVFISYSSEDEASAQSAYEDLAANGLRCTNAPGDLIKGRFSNEKSMIALENSSAVVWVLSRASVKSDHVLKEIDRAISLNLKLFIIKLEEVPLSGDMADKLASGVVINSDEDPDHLKLVEKLLNLSNASKSQIKPETIQAKITTRRVLKPILVSIAGTALIIWLSTLIH